MWGTHVSRFIKNSKKLSCFFNNLFVASGHNEELVIWQLALFFYSHEYSLSIIGVCKTAMDFKTCVAPMLPSSLGSWYIKYQMR